MPRRSLSLRASPGGLLVPVGCPVLSVWPWRAFLSSCPVLSVWPWRAFLSSCPVLSVWPWRAFLSSCPVLSVWPWRAVLSCFVLSCLFSPGGLLIPPHFPMEILGGGSRVPAVGAGSRPRAPKTICHGPQSSQLRHGPQSSQLRHGFQSSQLRHGPCLSVLLWRSPSCIPVCVCPEGPPERPPPLPDGTVKARDEPFGRGELCQSSVVCHVSLPHVSLFGLFPVLV